MGTINSLGRLTDGNERYVVIVDPSAPHWLDRHVGANTEVVIAGEPLPGGRDRVKSLLGPVLPLLRQGRSAARFARLSPTWSVAPYDRIVEALQPDVVHFPYQWLHVTSAPSIFNPQDVQHMHYPDFFTKEGNQHRMAMYKLWCRAATVIEVPSHASKDDLVRLLGVAEDRVLVIPKAAPTALEPAPVAEGLLSAVRTSYDLPNLFVFYPAQTWPHKNHLRLLDAIAMLRDEHDVSLHLVCTGVQNDFWPAIRARIHALKLDGHVRFLGFIPPEHVKALYRLARFTVFPTLFEGGGFPVLEAMSEGSPLACSDLPVLREQISDAALVFDPASPASIASALLQLHGDDALRVRLGTRGRVAASRYTWDRTARTYRALYRKLGNAALTDEDRALLAEASDPPTMRPGDAIGGPTHNAQPNRC